MCIYIDIYIYTHVYARIYTYIDIRVYVGTYIHTHIQCLDPGSGGVWDLKGSQGPKYLTIGCLGLPD